MSLKFQEMYADYVYLSDRDKRMIATCQRWFDEWLSKAPVVYGHRNNVDKQEVWFYSDGKNHPVPPCIPKEMTARLVCIEEIKKCEHPKEKCTAQASGSRINSDGSVDASCVVYQCECGAKVKPVAFEEISK